MALISRAFAAAVSILSIGALLLQYRVALDAPLRPPGIPVWWWLGGYFTILTNLGVAVILARVALGGRITARLAAGLVLSILVVGIVYHLILARLWAPQGLAWWADQGLHTADPVLAFLWWLAFADKRLSLSDLPWWLAWPGTYAVYALTRGALTGFWPYPFLDADALGWTLTSVNVAAMVLAFAAMGLLLLGIARWSVR